MDTSTIPHWLPVGSPPPNPEYPLGNPARIDQGQPGFGFDHWELAAAAIGTATSKSVPVTIDTIQYYNRIASRGVDNWGAAPKLLTTANGEKFIDYRTFSYSRSEVYQGCTTWLDVPTLRWKWDKIVNRVDFGTLAPVAVGGTVTNVAGFAQMADDVRSVIDYLHNNEVVVNPDTGEGFFIDPVFEESCDDQAAMVQKLNTAVDPSPPTVAITSAPTAVTTAATATFVFTASADAASVLCVVDGGPIELCTSSKSYTGLEPGEHTFTVIAGSTAGNFVSATHTWTILPPGEDSIITPVELMRLADTRPGFVASDGLFFGLGPVPAGGVVQVPVAGRGGVPVGAKAVVANVTVVGASTGGFVTVFPCGTVPATSSVNYSGVAGEAVANEVIAKLSPAGSICVYAHSAVNVVVDVSGHF
jgi:hypothetical protein